ncbi:MAG: nucleoside-diphosphate kinase [Pseudomonadota bacterium]
MSYQKTLSIIKPDAVKNGHIGEIIAMLEKNGFNIHSQKMLQLTRPAAEGFYAEHHARPFFGGLVDFMTSGPCVVMVLGKDNAVVDYRALMGATNPENADDGTIRKLYAADVQHNAVHGSDSTESAAREVSYFFDTAGQMDIDAAIAANDTAAAEAAADAAH